MDNRTLLDQCREHINVRLADISAAITQNDMQQPRFTSDAELKAWKAKSRASEEAAQSAAIELIGDALLAFQSIAHSLQVIANAQKKPAAPLFDMSHNGPHSTMPKLDQ